MTSKYRNRLQRILLSVYIVSLIAGIFHYHHFDFSVTQKVESEQKAIATDFQLVGGNTYECIIQQNLTNLQTAFLIFFNDNQYIADLTIAYQNFKSQLYIKQIYLTNSLLRAPPALS